VLKAAGETETKQENIQGWLKVDEGDPGFQFVSEEEIAALILFIYLFIFISTTYIIKCSIYLFSEFFLSGISFASLIRISEVLLYRVQHRDGIMQSDPC
jgi:hypothetical protein